MTNFWDERFASSEYVYGKMPNEFYRTAISKLEPGTILLPGEGEGRNAVYAASKGWKVTAVDQSKEGRRKALELAEEFGVEIEYELAAFPGFMSKSKFDAIGIVFLHFLPQERIRAHHQLLESLREGGYFIMEAFHKDQIHNGTGGPPNRDMLYSLDDIRSDFKDCEILTLEHRKTVLKEGVFHQGVADVISMIARKK